MHAFLMSVKYCTYIYCKGTLDTCIETISDPFSSCSHPSFLSIPLEIEKGFLRPRLLFICLNAMDICVIVVVLFTFLSKCVKLC